MPIFPDFPMLPHGSLNEHHAYIAQFNYRYYCVSCVRSMDSTEKLEKCAYCSSTNLILLKEKEIKEKVKLQERIGKLVASFRAVSLRAEKPKEEMPTG